MVNLVLVLLIISIISSLFRKTNKSILYCGIFGGIGKVDPKKINHLMLENESRGGHAVGFYSDIQGIIKKAMTSKRFILSHDIQPCNILLGHTRFGTHGSNIDKNAHPFQKDNIIAIHNGVLSNHTELGKTYGFTPIVDSEAIPELLSRKGYKGLEEIQGSIAEAWTDETGNLYLYRRTNPLYIGFSGGTLYFSSLEGSLKDIGCPEVKQIDSNTVYIFDRDTQLVDLFDVKEPAYSYPVKQWTDYQKPAKYTQMDWRDWEDDYEGDTYRYGKKEEPKVIPLKVVESKEEVEETFQYYEVDEETMEDTLVVLMDAYNKLKEIQDWDMNVTDIMANLIDVMSRLNESKVEV